MFIEEEQVIGVDCDGTLVLWRAAEEGEETVDIIDPYDGTNHRLVLHKPHIKLVKDRSARGCKIIIWSQSGPQWAKAVAEAVGLNSVNPIIMGKPFMIVDDLPASAWLNNRVFLEPNTGYGNNFINNQPFISIPFVSTPVVHESEIISVTTSTPVKLSQTNEGDFYCGPY